MQHLLDECAAAGVTQIHGEIPYTHPFVDALVATADADLGLTGDSSMMALPFDLGSLIAKAVPEAAESVTRAAGRYDVSASVWRVFWPRLGTCPPRSWDLAGGRGGSAT